MLQNLDQLCYLHCGIQWLTERGVQVFIEHSNNHFLKNNKESFEKLLEDNATELLAQVPLLASAAQPQSQSEADPRDQPQAMPQAQPQTQLQDQPQANSEPLPHWQAKSEPLPQDQPEILVRHYPNVNTCDDIAELRAQMDLYYLCFQRPKAVKFEEEEEILNIKWDEEDLKAFEEAKKSKEPITGEVYVLKNVYFPGLLKIGATFRTAAIRARELSRTALPEPFIVLGVLKCRNPFSMEKEIHAHYADVRKYGKRKEFFTLKNSEVLQYIQTLTEKAMRVPSEQEEIAILNRLRRMKRWGKDQENYTSKEESTSKTCNEKETSDTPNASEKTSDGSVPNMSKEYIEKQRMIELDRQNIENKQRLIDLDRQAVEIKQKHILLEYQAGIFEAENRKRMIELDRQNIENKQRMIESWIVRNLRF